MKVEVKPKFNFKYTTFMFTTEVRGEGMEYYYKLTENRNDKVWKVEIKHAGKDLFEDDSIPFVDHDFTLEITDNGLRLNGIEFTIIGKEQIDLLVESFPMLMQHRKSSESFVEFQKLQEDIEKDKKASQTESKKAFGRAAKHAEEVEKKRLAKKERSMKRGAKKK